MSERVAGGLLAVVIMTIIGVPLMILNGVAIQVGWAWFLAPVFTGIPAKIGLLQAMGLSLVFNFLTYKWQDSQSSDDEPGKTIAKVAAYYILYFLVAFILHALIEG
jgi:uncharacterized membrane protein